MAKVSNSVARHIASLFGRVEDSDCNIIFYLEAAAHHGAGDETNEVDVQPEAKRQRTESGSRAACSQGGMREGATLFGGSLPAHQLVLRSCSERFAAQIRRWDADKDTRLPCERLVLRVPLGSEAEVTSARAAIRFAYTGEVAADSVREVLEVRRQGAYLGIEGCGAACMERIQSLLVAASVTEQPAAGGGGAAAMTGDGGGQAGDGSARTGRLHPPLRELFACKELWLDVAEEPGFAAVLACAKHQLVTYFGDALLVLNMSSLLSKMKRLPAVALEALLESDDFGTDSESSVLLMLAEWIKANYDSTDAETRARLCRQVRLVQLSRAYLMSVLPALAAEYEAGTSRPPAPASSSTPPPAAWFPISAMEAAFIANMAGASMSERKALEVGTEGVFDLGMSWYLTRPRRQCLPPAGSGYRWHIKQEKLDEVLGRLQPGETSWVQGARCLCSTNGFLWGPCISLKHGTADVQLGLYCGLPPVFSADSSVVGITRSIVAAASVNSRLVVYHWQNGARKSEVLRIPPSAHTLVSSSEGPCKVLLHVRQPAAGDVDRPLDAWAAYVHDGEITGTLTFLPPSAA